MKFFLDSPTMGGCDARRTSLTFAFTSPVSSSCIIIYLVCGGGIFEEFVEDGMGWMDLLIQFEERRLKEHVRIGAAIVRGGVYDMRYKGP